MTAHQPPGTLRIIGAVVVAGGRAVDIALIESDGESISRRMEFERAPLANERDAASAAILVFMGNRALQPMAIDVVAVPSAVDLHAVDELRRRHGMRIEIIDPTTQWPRLPLAERIALVAGHTLAVL